MKKSIILSLLVFLVFMALSQGVAASDYPTRPIKLILGFTPGGGADNCSKAFSKRASEVLGQPIVSEYKTGSGASISAAYVAKSKPDGYTLWVGSTTPASIAPLVKTNLGYTMDDFTIVCGYAMSAHNINVKKGSWNTLHEFIAAAKKEPGKYTYSTPAALSANHFMVEALAKRAGIKLTFVPYPGAAEANAALLGGHIYMSSVGGTSGLYEAGKITVLAFGEENRVKEFPEIPTLTELGYPVVSNTLYFLAAPKETPKEVLDKLYDAHKKSFAKYGEEITTVLKRFELSPAFLGPEEVRRVIKRDKEFYSEIAKDMGVLVSP